MSMKTPAAGSFGEITKLIEAARQKAFQAVNTVLIDLYWHIGKIISHKVKSAEWGDGVVAQLAIHIAQTQPGLRGFTRRNLFRMRQFYETYQDDEKVSALLTQLSWTNNLIILSQSKRQEEREFYLWVGGGVGGIRPRHLALVSSCDCHRCNRMILQYSAQHQAVACGADHPGSCGGVVHSHSKHCD